ncbi:MAG: arginine repressor [Clostridia bacterium]|nr:arginine repressor [Clostridia bacterium]
MKNERHSAILNLISQRRISTQDELVEALRESGYPVTQATISRDIRDLGLSKELDEQGVARYITAGRFKASAAGSERERFAQMFVSSVLGIQYANNMIVIHTLSGAANAAAEAVDGLHWPEILGTISGDNTIFAVVRTNDETPMVAQRLQQLRRRD